MSPRIVLALLLAAALLAGPVPRALADADPPSDVLLLQDVYYPYAPKVSPDLQAQLDDVVARARKAGFHIKVALVATRSDLGAIPQMLGHVTQYADLLQREIAYLRPQPTLAAMPTGFATSATGPQGPAIVAKLGAPKTVDGMARGAIAAVEQLAAANGHPLDTSDLGARRVHHHQGTPAVLLFAPFLLLALVLAALSRMRRRRTYETPSGGSES